MLISSGMFSPVAYAAEQTEALTVDAKGKEMQEDNIYVAGKVITY